EALLQLVDGREVFFLARLSELLERRVGARYVRRVVLVVVELQLLCGVVRLERGVIVGKLGERVLLHRLLLRRPRPSRRGACFHDTEVGTEGQYGCLPRIASL